MPLRSLKWLLSSPSSSTTSSKTTPTGPRRPRRGTTRTTSWRWSRWKVSMTTWCMWVSLKERVAAPRRNRTDGQSFLSTWFSGALHSISSPSWGRVVFHVPDWLHHLLMTGRILFKNTLEAYTDYYLQNKLNQVVQEHRLVSLITLLRGNLETTALPVLLPCLYLYPTRHPSAAALTPLAHFRAHHGLPV